jgi:hypothetical protein
VVALGAAVVQNMEKRLRLGRSFFRNMEHLAMVLLIPVCRKGGHRKPTGATCVSHAHVKGKWWLYSVVCSAPRQVLLSSPLSSAWWVLWAAHVDTKLLSHVHLQTHSRMQASSVTSDTLGHHTSSTHLGLRSGRRWRWRGVHLRLGLLSCSIVMGARNGATGPCPGPHVLQQGIPAEPGGPLTNLHHRCTGAAASWSFACPHMPHT